jgi:hypothetical protein
MKLVLVFAAALIYSACGAAPCDVLDKQCDACTGTTGKAACKAVVATKIVSQAACEEAIKDKTYDASGTVCKQ